MDYRVQRWDGDLIVHGDDAAFAYGPSMELLFRGTSYVDLPSHWAGKSFRVATAAERAYVSSKSEVDPATVVVRIVDEQRIYFVACEDFSVTKLRVGKLGDL
jgi:hypothetical protein